MTQAKMTFAQGLQLLFVEKILTDKHTMGTEARSKRGIDFFTQWSTIVRGGRAKDETFPLTVNVPPDFGKDIPDSPAPVEGMQRHLDKTSLSFAREAYHDLLRNERFPALFPLLADEDLGLLMQIEYPSAAAERVAKAVGTTKDADIIREAMARTLGKSPSDLTAADDREILTLDLSLSQVSDLTLLQGLTKLQTLWLDGTPVSNIEPLKALTNLQELSLRNTQVSDLAPLSELTNLHTLSLADLPVSDLAPLKALTQLKVLYLSRTQVSNVEPLRALANLQALWLTKTQVGDVAPLKALTNLEALCLDGTQVRDLEPLKALTQLQRLWLNDTPVSNEQVEALRKALPKLEIMR